MIYLLALLGIAVIETALVLGILMVRPLFNPLEVAAVVTAIMVSVTASIVTFIKTSETHVLVNGVSHELAQTKDALARAEGRLVGIADEQARQALLLAKASQIALVEHALQSVPPQIQPTEGRT